MLFHNNEKVDLDDPRYVEVKDAFKKIEKMKGPIKIVSTKPTRFNNGRREPYQVFGYPTKVTVDWGGMSGTWRWSKAFPSPGKDGNYKFSQTSIKIDKQQLFLDPKRETDLVYYLLYLYKLVPDLGEGEGAWKIENPEKDAEKQLEVLGSEVDLNFYITSANSPLAKDTAKLRILASSWGVPNAAKMPIPILKLTLRNAVLASDKNFGVTNRGIMDFIDEVNGGDEQLEYRANIQKAIDNKVIGFDPRENNWYFLDNLTGLNSKYIVAISAAKLKQKQALLFDFFLQNPDHYAQLKRALSDVTPGEAPQEKVSKKPSWPEFVKKAASMGIETLHRNREAIEADYNKKIAEQF